jgi:hypothetical protein
MSTRSGERTGADPGVLEFRRPFPHVARDLMPSELVLKYIVELHRILDLLALLAARQIVFEPL